MSEAVLLSLIGFGGVLVTAGPSYLAHRTTRRRQAEAVTAAIDPVTARLDRLSQDVTEIRVSVAVHEDRWRRPLLRPLAAENRITPDRPT